MQTATYLGTSGWSYPSGYGKWRGIVYPPKWHGDELAYYAERFSSVEVNSSFYRLPTIDTVRGWLQRTPNSFLFSVKLFRKFTHPDFYAREANRSSTITPDDVAAMHGVLAPLAERGRLGALLVQYPDSFRQTADNLSKLVRTLAYFREYPLAVELRHSGWDNKQVDEVLAHFSAARVRLDEPLYQNMTTAYTNTSAIEYWRFHGRNAHEWQKTGDNSRRYDYLYTGEEIRELANNVEQQSKPGKKRMMFFNNHYHGQAIANAVSLAAVLGLPMQFDRFSNLVIRFPDLAPIVGRGGEQLRMLD